MNAVHKVFYTLFLISFVAAGVRAQTAPKITGTVRDTNGAVVAGATVSFIPDNLQTVLKTTTDENGHFTIDPGASDSGRLVVAARSFLRPEILWRAGNTSSEIEITLSPPPVSATVLITRTESLLEDTPASVVALDRDKLSSEGAQTLDDKLRQVPGFSLFRRAGSRTTNPTTQGVSLRGVGPSGASRAVVLIDGIPLNDPFGGWVYWGRVPMESIAEVEILRGAASDLYGTSAIGGAISITRRRPAEDTALSAEFSYGSQQTFNLSGFVSSRIDHWAGSFGVEAFRTDGFVTVDEPARGFADVPANVRRVVFDPEIEYNFAKGKRIFTSGSFYREKRGNGTPLQNNDTRNWTATVGADWEFNGRGTLTARAYGMTQLYNQTFTAVASDRNSEIFLRGQSVPSQVIGFSGSWKASFRKKFTYFAGGEGHETRGRSDETVYSNSRPSSLVTASGCELTLAAFAGGTITATSRILISGGLRFDWWRNSSAYSASYSLITGQRTLTIFPERSESAASPRAALLFRVTDNLSASTSFATGFRQPALNELYRSFRVGDVLTLANANLRAERAVNGEAGVIFNGFDRRLYARGNVFCTEITRPVANVTLTVTPTLITRQRQNLGRTRSCGLELDSEFKISRDLRLSAGYLFVDSRVVSFSANAALEGLRIPQVARHQFSFQVQYSNARTVSAGLQLRAAGSQFDDDQNLLKLKSYSTVDGLVSRRLNRWLSVFAAAENILDSHIESGRTPVLTLAAPRTTRIGLRFDLGKN